MEDRLLALLPQLLNPGPERNAAELALTQQLLPERPADVLAGLALVAGRRDVPEPIRIQSLVLLRRFAFRPLHDPAGPSSTYAPKEAWDELSIPAQSSVLSTLLQLFVSIGEPGRAKEGERHAVADMIGEMGKQSLLRGHPWTDLPQALLQSVAQPSFAVREAAFRIYAAAPKTLDDPFASAAQLADFLKRGLTDPESPSVRLTALNAAVAWIRSDEPRGPDELGNMVESMLGVLPPLVAEKKEERLTKALLSMVDVASVPRGANALVPILREVASFVLASIQAREDEGGFGEEVRQAGIEFLVATAENAGPAIISSPDGGLTFRKTVVGVLLRMMTELEDDESWYSVEQTNPTDDDDETYVVAEQAVDRIAQALVTDDESDAEPFTATIIEMVGPLAESERWQNRHAALSALATTAEGCVEILVDDDETTDHYNRFVESALADPHPRVRYASIYATAQLCSELDGAYQESYAPTTLRRLCRLMSDPHEQPRVQAFAAAALINFTDQCSPSTLRPHLPDLFKSLLTLLNGGRRFVQEAAVRAMSGVIGAASSVTPGYYAELMPLLLSILETPLDVQYRGLVAKSMDCAVALAGAVSPQVFLPDGDRLAKAIIAAHSTVVDETDPVASAVITSLPYLAGPMGPERFVPYLGFLLPALLHGVNIKPDVSISGALDGEHEYDEEWETLDIGGQTLGIRTAALEEKATAVDMLGVLCAAMGKHLLPHYPTIIDATLPLLKFYFSEDVRAGAAFVLPSLVKGSKAAQLPPDQLTHIVATFADAILDVLSVEANFDFVATLLSTWSDCFEELPSAFAAAHVSHLLQTCESILQQVAVRETTRQGLHAGQHVSADDELDLQDAEEADAAVLQALVRTLRLVIGVQKEAFDLRPFRGHFDAWIRHDPSVSAPAHRWALRIAGALVQSWGPASVQVVGPVAGDIVSGIRTKDLEVRFTSAFVVGCCAASASSAYAQVINASIPALLEGFARGNGSDAARLARENCVSAVAKIIRNPADGLALDADQVLPKWVAALPVELDTEEIEPTYGLLLELIARAHPSVSPSKPALAAHVVSALAAPLAARGVPGSFGLPLATGLRSYLGQVSEAQRDQLWQTLTPSVQKAVQGLE